MRVPILIAATGSFHPSVQTGGKSTCGKTARDAARRQKPSGRFVGRGRREVPRPLEAASIRVASDDAGFRVSTQVAYVRHITTPRGRAVVDFVAYHDRTGQDHQNHFDTLYPQ